MSGRRSSMKLSAVALGAVFAFAVSQSPAGTSAASPTVELFAKASLTGMKLGLRKGVKEGRLSQEDADCVLAKGDDSLVPVFGEAFADNWSAADLKAADAFVQSPPGRKFAKLSLLQIYSSVGAPMPEPLPTFSADDERKIEAFRSTQAGEKFMDERKYLSEKGRQIVRSGLMDLVKSCGLRP